MIKDILFGTLFIFLSIMVLSSIEYEEVFTCNKNADYCEYKTNTFLNKTMINKMKFKLSTVTEIKPSIYTSQRTRKGRTRQTTHYRIELVSEGRSYNYPYSLENENAVQYKIAEIENYINNTNIDIYNESKRNFIFPLFGGFFLFGIFIFFRIFIKQKKTNEELIKRTKEELENEKMQNKKQINKTTQQISNVDKIILGLEEFDKESAQKKVVHLTDTIKAIISKGTIVIKEGRKTSVYFDKELQAFDLRDPSNPEMPSIAFSIGMAYKVYLIKKKTRSKE